MLKSAVPNGECSGRGICGISSAIPSECWICEGGERFLFIVEGTELCFSGISAPCCHANCSLRSESHPEAAAQTAALPHTPREGTRRVFCLAKWRFRDACARSPVNFTGTPVAVRGVLASCPAPAARGELSPPGLPSRSGCGTDGQPDGQRPEPSFVRGTVSGRARRAVCARRVHRECV